MTQHEILAKAMKKAAMGGWHPGRYIVGYRDFKNEKEWEIWTHYSIFDIIFNHDFAKALWGDGEPRKYNGFNMETGKMMTEEEKENYIPKSTPAWKIYLQQMVIADNPIEYLGRNL